MREVQLSGFKKCQGQKSADIKPSIAYPMSIRVRCQGYCFSLVHIALFMVCSIQLFVHTVLVSNMDYKIQLNSNLIQVNLFFDSHVILSLKMLTISDCREQFCFVTGLFHFWILHPLYCISIQNLQKRRLISSVVCYEIVLYYYCKSLNKIIKKSCSGYKHSKNFICHMGSLKKQG